MLFLAPYRMPLNENGRVQPGVKIWFTQTGTDVEVDTYSDGDLTTVNANPYIASGTGRVDPIFLDPAVTYRIRLYSPWATPGVDTPLEEYDPYSPMVDAGVLADATGDDGSGSDLLGWRQGGAGAVARSVRDKLRDFIHVKDFGAVGDGVADDTAALQAAVDSVGSAGGRVYCGNLKLRLASTVTVKANVALFGDDGWTGRSTVGPGTDTNYEAMGGIRLDASATLTLKGGSSLNGLLIYRYGATFPEADSSAFSGTAITVDGDDVAVSRCFVMGFNRAFLCNGFVRPRVEYLYFDCLNGVRIENCGDIAYVNSCHGWPWATIAALGVHQTIERSGAAFELMNTVDWAKVSDCFCYGYTVGFKAENVNSCTFLNCSCDNTFEAPNTSLHTNAVGFAITGTSGENRLIGCQSAAHGQTGIWVNTMDGVQTTVTGCNIWSVATHGILIEGGNVNLGANSFRNTPSGITVNDANSRVTDLGGNIFEDCASPWSIQLATSKVRINPFNDYPDFGNGTPAGTNLNLPSIASADPLNIPSQGDAFNITGTTGFGTIGGGYAGRTITLFFAGALTVFTGTGTVNSVRLSGAVNFAVTAGGSLTLRHNGVQWFEVGRSA